jgi:tetratricopeptide (TPR) repeat protein
MKNLLKSFFSSSGSGSPANIHAKNEQKNFDVFKYDGVRAMGMGQTQYAVKCFKEALKIKEDTETIQFLIIAYVTLQQADEALEANNRLVELLPDNISALLTRAGLFIKTGQNEEAIADCLRIIEAEDANADAWYLMGQAKKSLNDLPGAISDFTQAIARRECAALKEVFTDARLMRAEALFESQQPAEALPDVEVLIQSAPEAEAAYLLRGRIHESLGNLPAAAADYEKVVVLNPFNEEALLLKGSLLIKEGKLDEAIAFFDEVIELAPEHPQVYRVRGKAKSLKGDEQGALEDETKAEELEAEGEDASDNKPTNFDDMYQGGIF